MTTLASLREQALNENIPVISPRNAVFLQSVLMQHKPMRMLEIGSAIGVSTAVIAQVLSLWGGQLISTEISVPTQRQAQANMEALGLCNVQSFCGDARRLLQTWKQHGERLTTLQTQLQCESNFAPFDCVFIDAQKNQTHSFYAACLPMLTDKALIIVDDVWRFRHKMPFFYALLQSKMQTYSLHFVDDEDATMLINLC